MRSRRADGDDELAAAAVERDAGHPGHLRVLDPERRRLAHLPANQLVEILRLGRHLLEPDQRDLGDRIGQHQRDAARAAATACRARPGSPPSAPPASCTLTALSAGSTAPAGSGSAP